MSAVRHLNDMWFTIVAEPHDYHVAYSVYEIYGTDTDGRIYWRNGDDGEVDTLEAAAVFLHGDVKWDGCSDWHFDEQDRVMLHACSRQTLVNLGAVMAACWDWTAELLPTWDKSVATA
jgi:hypothetical protein